MRVLWFLHRVVRRVSGGRLGTSVPRGGGLGTIFLTTIGRKSGEARTTGLNYILDGPNRVVIASNAGSDADPAWWLNLQAQPDAGVEIDGKRIPVRARAATDEEAATLWPRFVAANADYAGYRAKAARPIPIVILEPRAG
jgi:deazaflavin-dependent oxidoreductase (nitroreductase family)